MNNVQVATAARILVIDDDDLVRDSICVYLEDCGYRVTSVARSRDGLKSCKDDPPAVVLCDLRMPDLDGLKVLEVLTREQPGLPVIVISGAGVMTDVVQALRLGAADYLVKPIADLAVLQHAIESVLHKVTLEKENEQYREELEKANSELEENLDLLRKDHEAGRQAQLQLLPEPRTVFAGWEFTHAVVPSLYLSGDFLDYFEIDEHRIGFYIADVSGHGAASAFVTMMLKSLINHPLRRFRSHGETVILEPSALLKYLNHELLQANLGKYITLFYGVLDHAERRLRFANGGHFPRPLLLADGVQQFIGESSFPVGLFDWATYPEFDQILPGRAELLMCSDGVLELSADAGLAKDESLISSLAMRGPLSVQGLLAEIRKHVPDMPIDDIAVFLIREIGYKNP
jgi:serine phosphatase RsbU (regulator of sigma subunit)